MSALTIVGTLVALGLAIAGIAALLRPQSAAHAYGLPGESESSHAFVRAAGLRDLALAAILGAAVYFHVRPLLIVVAAAGIVLSVADWYNAYHSAGRQLRREHASHLTGAIAFVLVLTMALFAFGI